MTGPEWRNWQTQETQNLPPVTRRVGSIPSSGTTRLARCAGSLLAGSQTSEPKPQLFEPLNRGILRPVTTIGPTIVISGELTSGEDITVLGRVNGHLHVRDAQVTISDQADVRADVRGARVFVHGQLKGSIVASERIELSQGAQVEGSLSANRVVLVDGTRFNGRIDMGQRTIAARIAHFKASQQAAS